VAGAPPPTRTIERVETELGWEFIQIYGLTETAPLLTMNRGRAEWDDLDPAERAAKLAAPGRRRSASHGALDDQGEVLARGNHVLEGYWEQPEATADAIVDGWFHTGDGGTIDDEGYVTISDRKKDVIISGRRERVVDRGGGRAVQPPRGGRGGGDRRARREVGRAGDGRSWCSARASR
jgi:fatty-acyl-CoA synthase